GALRSVQPVRYSVAAADPETGPAGSSERGAGAHPHGQRRQPHARIYGANGAAKLGVAAAGKRRIAVLQQGNWRPGLVSPIRRSKRARPARAGRSRAWPAIQLAGLVIRAAAGTVVRRRSNERAWVSAERVG